MEMEKIDAHIAVIRPIFYKWSGFREETTAKIMNLLRLLYDGPLTRDDLMYLQPNIIHTINLKLEIKTLQGNGGLDEDFLYEGYVGVFRVQQKQSEYSQFMFIFEVDDVHYTFVSDLYDRRTNIIPHGPSAHGIIPCSQLALDWRMTETEAKIVILPRQLEYDECAPEWERPEIDPCIWPRIQPSRKPLSRKPSSYIPSSCKSSSCKPSSCKFQ